MGIKGFKILKIYGKNFSYFISNDIQGIHHLKHIGSIKLQKIIKILKWKIGVEELLIRGLQNKSNLNQVTFNYL